MLLGISNIGWQPENDKAVYKFMKEYGYSGLEIAPTRIYPETPYERLEEAKNWSQRLKDNYGFVISSMQSIWYGRQERLFGTQEERKILLNYTKRAIKFAAAIKCKNLVFGCPKNRVLPKEGNPYLAVEFFKELGDYAVAYDTTISLEANPSIYGTNYINDTKSAFELIERIHSKGILLNLDVGTMIQNKEKAKTIEGQVHLINHVHMSEPNLKPIEKRKLHRELLKILKSENYAGFVSIEMGRADLDVIKGTMEYVKEVFNNDL